MGEEKFSILKTEQHIIKSETCVGEALLVFEESQTLVKVDGRCSSPEDFVTDWFLSLAQRIETLGRERLPIRFEINGLYFANLDLSKMKW